MCAALHADSLLGRLRKRNVRVCGLCGRTLMCFSWASLCDDSELCNEGPLHKHRHTRARKLATSSTLYFYMLCMPAPIRMRCVRCIRSTSAQIRTSVRFATVCVRVFDVLELHTACNTWVENKLNRKSLFRVRKFVGISEFAHFYIVHTHSTTCERMLANS